MKIKGSKFKHNQYLVKEDNDFFLYIGHPKLPTSSKVNVNMVVKIGLAIGSKNYKDIEYLKLT